MKIEEKLTHFREAANAKAVDQKNTELEDIERQFEEACRVIDAKALHAAEERRKAETFTVEQEMNKKILAAKRDVNLSLFAVRGELTEKVFSDVRRELGQFMKGPNYPAKVKAEAAETRARFKGRLTFSVNPADMDILKGCFDLADCSVEMAEGDILGGFVARTDKNVIFDCSYAERFDAARARFNKFKVI